MRVGKIAALSGAVAVAGVAWLATAEPELAVEASSPPRSSPSTSDRMAPASFAQIARRVSPAVVTLIAKEWLGSGFVIDKSGFIVTNAHVVEGQETMKVHFADGTRYVAKVIGTDRATDVALLKITAKKTFPAVALGNDRNVAVGDWVLAIGSPDGLQGTVTAGIISTVHRDGFKGARVFTDYLQIDAAINHGNSGGPTFDMNGLVIGMNTLGSYISTNCSGKLCERNDGIGFSIPVSTIRMVVEDLKTGPVHRGVAGLLVEPLTEEAAKALGLTSTHGAIVSDVVADSPAEAAGVKAGDVILKLNGTSVKDHRDLMRRTAMLDAGQSAKLSIWRDGKQIAVTVKIVDRASVIDLTPGDDTGVSADQKTNPLGMEFQSMPAGAAVGYGLTVSLVVPESDAALKGLKPGDKVLRVAGQKVQSMSDLNLAVETARSLKREYILLYVETKAGGKSYVAVKVAPE